VQVSTVHATPSSQPPPPAPQKMVWPQPSDIEPHSQPPGHLAGTHTHV
jgi:hypothetical protein